MRENCYISTSCLKCDVTIVFLDKIFCRTRINFGDSRTFNAFIELLMYFEDLFAKMGFRDKWGKRWRELDFTFGDFCVCANFDENPPRNRSVGVYADGHTDKGKLVL